jgi:hypothetical protein
VNTERKRVKKMGIKRIVDTSFWTDGKVDDFSPEDKYFMLYLLTNPSTTQLGIYEISIKQVAFQLGYSQESVRVLIDRFQNKYGLVIYSEATGEIAIKNFLRHSIIKGGKPVEDCIKAEMSKVKNKRLISLVFNHIAERGDLNSTVNKIIVDYQNENEYENEYDNDNENENENDVSSVRYVDVSSAPHKKAKPTKHKYGEYKNVLLTDEELEKLKDEFPDWEERIERLSSYVASTGKSYKNHLATIRNWARKELEVKPINRQPYAKQTKADELNDFYAMASAWAEGE